MSLIINDFEIIAPPPQEERPAERGQAARQQPPKPPLRPYDVELIMRRAAERRLRLWAD